MNNVAIVAIDLGKHTFHLHAQDDRGHELYHKKFNRAGLARHLANLEPCTVAMEACGGAHYMAREAAKWGHVPKLIAPHLVRPYVKSNKNDFADAMAICEAASRPTMRFVPLKPKRNKRWPCSPATRRLHQGAYGQRQSDSRRPVRGRYQPVPRLSRHQGTASAAGGVFIFCADQTNPAGAA
ncbi:IS110 family transposase [Pseudomonas sp. BIC9C]|uniref:IS110 family transposase n=1 Tax=Pseudomonas sp. BIC9C TaxID=3078458 RepID=UPI003A523605